MFMLSSGVTSCSLRVCFTCCDMDFSIYHQDWARFFKLRFAVAPHCLNCFQQVDTSYASHVYLEPRVCLLNRTHGHPPSNHVVWVLAANPQFVHPVVHHMFHFVNCKVHFSLRHSARQPKPSGKRRALLTSTNPKLVGRLADCQITATARHYSTRYYLAIPGTW